MKNAAIQARRRGTLGGSEHRNTAKKFGKYRNTAKKNSANTAIPQKKKIRQIHKQLNTESKTRCNPEISTPYVKLSANNIEIIIKYYLLTESEVITGKPQAPAAAEALM